MAEKTIEQMLQAVMQTHHQLAAQMIALSKMQMPEAVAYRVDHATVRMEESFMWVETAYQINERIKSRQAPRPAGRHDA